VRMGPLDAVAGPLRKWETVAAPTADSSAATANGLPFGLPLEVTGLFAVILVVGIIGLVQRSGVLPADAPMVGIGETREQVSPAAEEAQSTAEAATQAEQEAQYFKELAASVKSKRTSKGGAKKSKRKR